MINPFLESPDSCGHFEEILGPGKTVKYYFDPNFQSSGVVPARKAVEHFLTVDYSSLAAALSFASIFKPLGWTKQALPENSSTNFLEVPV